MVFGKIKLDILYDLRAEDHIEISAEMANLEIENLVNFGLWCVMVAKKISCFGLNFFCAARSSRFLVN